MARDASSSGTEPDPVSRESAATGRETDALATEDVSSELLATLLAVMPDAAVVVNGDGAIVALNQQAESLFGYAASELTGRTVEILVPERLRHAHRHDRGHYLKTPRARAMGVGLDLVGRRKDGSEFPVDISLAPIRGANRPLIVAGVRDISRARAATAAQAQLAAIVQSSLDAILALTLDGKVTSWNPGAERLLGYTPEEIVGCHVGRLLPEGGSRELEELLDAVMADRPPVARDTQWMTKEGSRLDVGISVSPLRDSTDRLIGFSVLLRDITARKRAETLLRQQERWQSAAAEIRLAFLSNWTIDRSLELICTRSCDLIHADVALIMVVDDDVARVAAIGGATSAAPGEEVPTLPPIASEALASGQTQIAAAGSADPWVGGGPQLAAPILSERKPVGVLLVARSQGRAEFAADDIEMADGFAGQAGLGLERAEARQAREQLLLSGDRERIGRDLHDLVIQRLFGTGMGLQGILHLVDNERAAERIATAVDDLDATIREIRTTIFQLEMPVSAAAGLRTEIMHLVDDTTESLGFEPNVHFDGPVDSVISDDVKAELLAVVREALSNVARHSHGSHADVDLRVGDEVVLVVSDDGVGLKESGRRSGLANVQARAEKLGGSLRVTSPSGGGTRLEWRVPMGGG
jgi:PAS domain S-box-containing protein